MLEYIEREALLKKASEVSVGGLTIGFILSAILNAPAADVVEVVRCKDCKYWVEEKGFGMFCGHWGSTLAESQADDFCSYGEAKMDGKGEGE